MQKLLLLLIVAAVIFLLLQGALKKPGQDRPSGRWPLYARRLLTEREQVFYWRLVRAFPEHVILTQVALSQLLAFERGAMNQQAIGNRFRQLCADFVICNRAFAPLAVIELDGLSHDHPRKQDADLRKGHALASARLPLYRVNAKNLPDETQLREMLNT